MVPGQNQGSAASGRGQTGRDRNVSIPWCQPSHLPLKPLLGCWRQHSYLMVESPNMAYAIRAEPPPESGGLARPGYGGRGLFLYMSKGHGSRVSVPHAHLWPRIRFSTHQA